MNKKILVIGDDCTSYKLMNELFDYNYPNGYNVSILGVEVKIDKSKNVFWFVGDIVEQRFKGYVANDFDFAIIINSNDKKTTEIVNYIESKKINYKIFNKTENIKLICNSF